MDATMTPVSARVSFTETTSGSFDNDGIGRNQQALPHSLKYQGVIPVYSGETFTTLRTLEDSLRAAVGTRAKLYRRARDNEEVHWCYARLTGMPYDTSSKDKSWRTISLDFQQLTRWYGVRHDDPWTFDSGELFDDALVFDEDEPTILNTNPKVVTVTNNGNIPIRDAQIVITAAGSPITVLIISNDDIDLAFLGTVDTGDSLTIDAGAWTVINSGVDAYEDFDVGFQHFIEPWLEFPPGDTQITIARTGGSAASTAAIVFRDGWA